MPPILLTKILSSVKPRNVVAFRKLLFCLPLAVFLIACGSDEPTQTAEPSKTTQVESAQPTPVPTPAREFPDEPIPLKLSALELSQSSGNAEAGTATIHIHTEGDRKKPVAGERVFIEIMVKSPDGKVLLPAPQPMSFVVGESSVVPSWEEAVQKLGVGATATVTYTPVPDLWKKLVPSKADLEPLKSIIVEFTRLPEPTLPTSPNPKGN